MISQIEGRALKITDVNVSEMDQEALDEHSVIQLKKRVDLLITYLRAVHLYEYYSNYEADSPEAFVHRSSVCQRTPDLTYEAESFLKTLDSRIDMRINSPNENLESVGGKNLNAEVEAEVMKHIQKENDAKYRCRECSKLFKGEDFVRKHIKAKHPALIDDFTIDIEMFNAFCRDPNKLRVEPVAPKEPERIERGDSYRPSSSGRDRGYKRPYSGNSRRSSHPPQRDEADKGGRSRMSYVDLDAPPSGDMVISYD